MDKQQVGKVMLKHSLCWGWAILTPPVVMVVLDLFDKHTPTNIALASSVAIMFPFIFANKYVSQGFAKLARSESES